MSKNLSEYLVQLQNLTKKNLEILKGINQSFYTKAEHLSVNVDEETYTIPSFLSLENKINALQDNFENLVNAPKTGDAAFDFNGNTQTIELKGFSNTPAAAFGETGVETDAYLDFDHETNHIFKDFCTPQPFVKLDLTNLPTDIHQVYVKKIIPKSDTFTSFTSGVVGTNVDVTYNYSDLAKVLYQYESGIDYEEYNTVYDLPIRGNIGYGTYKITNISKNWTDDDLDEHYTLTLDTLKYKTNDETFDNTLKVGNTLVTSNDVIKLLIEDVKISTSQITVKVLNGGYVDLVVYSSGNEEGLGTLKYLPSQDWTNYKYLNLPLEENQYVYVFVSPIDRVSNIQSNWGYGILFNVYNLKCNINGTTYYFKDYYDKFVNNVGDSLTGITDMFDISLVNFTEAQYKQITDLKPSLDKEALKVLEINKHLSNSDTVSEIYGLYEQKQQYKTELKDTQDEIDNINALLSELSFTDTTQNRTVYEQQLTSLSSKKKELTANIESIIKEISTAATDTDTPIDNPKYRIRGFFDYSSIDTTNKALDVKVIGIDVQYRYKNANKSTGTATHVGNDTDNIFSDWNQMISPLNKRRATFEGVSTGFSYEYETDNTNINEISFNQIDIPINQGETVDVRLRVIYNVGQPFIEVVSDWSDIINIEFPTELKKNVTVLDIIDENNNDVQDNKFTAILNENKVLDHTADSIVDQNVTFFHDPAHISSGFYTDERRIIPLFDKLKAMSDEILLLQDEIEGSETSNLTVEISDDTHVTSLIPYTDVVHKVKSYQDAEKIDDGNISYSILNLKITNTSNHIVKLFSIIPGSPETEISNSIYPTDQIGHYRKLDSDSTIKLAPYFVDGNDTQCPVCNQVFYFRLTNLYNSSYYYTEDGDATHICGGTNVAADPTTENASTLYPTFTKIQESTGSESNSIKSDYCIDPSENGKYKVLQPGESIDIPLMFKYYLNASSTTTSKTMSMDIRTSLYKDPINYTFTITAKYNDTLGDKINKRTAKTKYSPVVVKSQSVQVPKTISKSKVTKK